jgi:hypothetical protein
VWKRAFVRVVLVSAEEFAFKACFSLEGIQHMLDVCALCVKLVYVFARQRAL